MFDEISNIDNFSGEGKSRDYEEDEFENWEHIDTVDCEYDANKDPTDIYLHFGDKEIQFGLSEDNLYELKGAKYTKDDIINLVKVKNLLKQEKMTIKGAQERLKNDKKIDSVDFKIIKELKEILKTL